MNRNFNQSAGSSVVLSDLSLAIAKTHAVFSAPIWGGKKGEFRDWTKLTLSLAAEKHAIDACGR